jgi:hypothetical protein
MAKPTFPAAAASASVRRSGYPPARSAAQAGSATPCSSPIESRTASVSRFTHGIPPGSAPSSPPSRSTARSIDTVVCVSASWVTGSPARRASSLASSTAP